MAVKEQIIRLRAEVSDAQKGLRDVAKTLDEMSGAAEESGKKLDDSAKAMERAAAKGTALGTIVGQGVTKAFQLMGDAIGQIGPALERASQVDAVSQGFQKLQEQAGLLSDVSLAKLRESTRGLVDDFELMKQANQAALLGLPMDKFDELSGAAIKLGQAVGRDAVNSMDSLIAAVGRASPLMLDNLGITLKMEEAHRIYAASLKKSVDNLTAAEKAEAFREVAIQKILEKSQELVAVNDSAGVSYQRLVVSLTNLGDRMATSINENEDLARVINELSTLINEFDGSVMIGVFNDIAKAAVSVIKEFEELTFRVRVWGDEHGTILAEAVKENQKYIDTAKKLGELPAAYADIQSSLIETQNRIVDLTAQHGKNSDEVKRAQATLGAYEISLQRIEKTYGEQRDAEARLAEAMKSNRKGVAETGAESDKAAKKIANLRQQFDLLGQGTDLKGVTKGIEQAVKDVDKGTFDSLRKQFEGVFVQLKTDELTKKYGKAVSEAEIKEEVAKELGLAVDEFEKKFGEAVKKSKSEFDKLQAETKWEGLTQGMEKAIRDVNPAAFNVVSEEMEAQFRKVKFDELRKSLGKNISDAEVWNTVDAMWKNKSNDMATDFGKAMDDRLDKSADFFSDALYNAMTGAAFDWEDTMKRILAGLAGGFLAEISGGFGAGMGNVQGLGQEFGRAMAKELFGFGGGGGFDLGSFFGGGQSGGGFSGAGNSLLTSAGSYGYSYLMGQMMLGAEGQAALQSGQTVMDIYNASTTAAGLQSANAGLSYYAASILPYGSLAAGAYGAYNTYQMWNDGQRKPLRAGLTGAASGAAIGTYILPGVGTIIGGAIGGVAGAAGEYFGSSLSPEERWRGGVVDNLIEQGVLRDKGYFNLFGGGEGRIRARGESTVMEGTSAEDIGLGNLLSTLATGGVSEDLAAMFANALSEADSFNAAVLTTRGLMEKMGLDAESAGRMMVEAFYDGNLSLDEFNANLNTLAAVANEDLPSLADGIQLFNDTLDDPRSNVQALGLLLQEMAQEGITSAEDMKRFFVENFSPEIAESLSNITDAGIDTFDDVKNASVPQLQLIINEMDGVATAMREASSEGEEFGSSVARGAEQGAEGISKMTENMREFRQEVNNAKRDFDRLNADTRTRSLGVNSVVT